MTWREYFNKINETGKQLEVKNISNTLKWLYEFDSAFCHKLVE